MNIPEDCVFEVLSFLNYLDLDVTKPFIISRTFHSAFSRNFLWFIWSKEYFAYHDAVYDKRNKFCYYEYTKIRIELRVKNREMVCMAETNSTKSRLNYWLYHDPLSICSLETPTCEDCEGCGVCLKGNYANMVKQRKNLVSLFEFEHACFQCRGKYFDGEKFECCIDPKHMKDLHQRKKFLRTQPFGVLEFVARREKGLMINAVVLRVYGKNFTKMQMKIVSSYLMTPNIGGFPQRVYWGSEFSSVYISLDSDVLVHVYTVESDLYGKWYCIKKDKFGRVFEENLHKLKKVNEMIGWKVFSVCKLGQFVRIGSYYPRYFVNNESMEEETPPFFTDRCIKIIEDPKLFDERKSYESSVWKFPRVLLRDIGWMLKHIPKFVNIRRDQPRRKRAEEFLLNLMSCYEQEDIEKMKRDGIEVPKPDEIIFPSKVIYILLGDMIDTKSGVFEIYSSNDRGFTSVDLLSNIMNKILEIATMEAVDERVMFRFVSLNLYDETSGLYKISSIPSKTQFADCLRDDIPTKTLMSNK